MKSQHWPSAPPIVPHELLYRTSPRHPIILRIDRLLPIQVAIINLKSATLNGVEDPMPIRDCASFGSRVTNINSAITAAPGNHHHVKLESNL